MLAMRAARRFLHVSARACAEPAGSAAPTKSSELLLTLALPSRSLVAKKPCRLVTLPGADGVFGAEKNAPAVVAQLAPG